MNIALLATKNQNLISKLVQDGYQLKFDKSIRVYVKGNENWPAVNYRETEEEFAFFGGSIYESKSFDDMMRLLSSAPSALAQLDGDFFAFHLRKSDSAVTLVSDNAGILPLFYRMYEDGIAVTTDCAMLMKDFALEDLDLVAVYEMLRYAVLIGTRTFSKRVKFLPSGRILSYIGGQARIDIANLFTFKQPAQCKNIDCLVDEVVDAYENALKKRIDFDSNRVGLFLSGGMSSRMVLAFLNRVDPGATKCFSWGQSASHEVEIARTIAAINNNPFVSYELSPKDFIRDAPAYMKEVSGLDLMTQSYLLRLRHPMASEVDLCTSGTVLRGVIGDWALDEKACSYKGSLAAYLEKNLIAKSDIFTDEMIFQLCPALGNDVSEEAREDLLGEARFFDGYSVEDSVQAFWVNLRSKRMTLVREVSHREEFGFVCANFDKDFLDASSRIPSEERLNRKFFRRVIMRYASDYANVEFSNTSLPVSAPTELWTNGIRALNAREELYSKASLKLRECGESPLYFTHYYSDFVGYARYDRYWNEMLSSLFKTGDNPDIDELFDEHCYAKMLEEHRLGKSNHRKHLVVAASIKCFIMSMIEE